MELQKNDIRVGIFVLMSVLVLLATLVAIAQGRFGKVTPVVARFATISSIQSGTPVVIRGYRVGEVKRIDFVSTPSVHFDVHMVVAGKIRLMRGTRAIITSTNMIGDNYVLLDLPEVPTDTLRAGDVIPGESTQAIGDLVGRVNGVLAGTQQTVDRLAAALRSVNAEGAGPGAPGGAPTGAPAADRIPIAEITQVTAQLRDLLDTVNRTLVETKPAVAHTAELTQAELREARWTTAQAGSLLAENRQTIQSLLTHLDETTRNMNALLVEVHGIAEENRPEIARTLAELDKTSANLSRLSEDVADHPWKLLFR